VMVYEPAVLPALKSPEEEIVPPVADQVTAVFDEPVTVAENCWPLPVCMDAEVGLIATEIAGVVGLVLETEPGEPIEPAQPARLKTGSKAQRQATPRREGDGCVRGRPPACWNRVHVRQKGMRFLSSR
jgi:hypothetical protein